MLVARFAILFGLSVLLCFPDLITAEDDTFIPAQIIAQNTAESSLTINAPLSFGTINMKKHVKVAKNNSVFTVKYSGYYYISSIIDVTSSNTGDISSVISINDQNYANLIEDRIIFTPDITLSISNTKALYLEKGDRLSFKISVAPPDTVVNELLLRIIRSKDLISTNSSFPI